MSKKTITLIIASVLGAVSLFCLIVCIGCAVNGVTFGEQIVNWFGGSSTAITDTVIDEIGEVIEP